MSRLCENMYMETLIEFYGRECPHCERMEPLIERLKKEEGLEVAKYETWHNSENAEKMEQFDLGYCGGVPFFINTKTGKWICGETSYEEFKTWALGGK